VARPGRQAGIKIEERMSAEGATPYELGTQHNCSIWICLLPRLRRSFLIPSKPRPDGRVE